MAGRLAKLDGFKNHIVPVREFIDLMNGLVAVYTTAKLTSKGLRKKKEKKIREEIKGGGGSSDREADKSEKSSKSSDKDVEEHNCKNCRNHDDHTHRIRDLETALKTGRKQIDGEAQNDVRALGQQFATGDNIAREEAYKLVMNFQQQVIDNLMGRNTAGKRPEPTPDALMSLQNSSNTTRDGALTTLHQLYQRVLQARPMPQQLPPPPAASQPAPPQWQRRSNNMQYDFGESSDYYYGDGGRRASMDSGVFEYEPEYDYYYDSSRMSPAGTTPAPPANMPRAGTSFVLLEDGSLVPSTSGTFVSHAGSAAQPYQQQPRGRVQTISEPVSPRSLPTQANGDSPSAIIRPGPAKGVNTASRGAQTPAQGKYTPPGFGPKTSPSAGQKPVDKVKETWVRGDGSPKPNATRAFNLP